MTETAVVQIQDPPLPDGLNAVPTLAVYQRAPDGERQAFGRFVGNLHKLVKSALKLIDEQRDPEIKEAYAQHRSLTQAKAKVVEPFKNADAKLNVLATSFELHERELLRLEQRKREEEARRQEEERRIEEAAALEAMGDTQAAEEVISAPPVPIPVAPVARPVAPVSGNSLRMTWKGEVTNLLDLLRGIVANQASAGFVTVNQSAIDQHARSTKGTVPVPGVKFTEHASMAVSTR